MSILKGILVVLVAYGLGSLSFAYIITKALIGKDIRTLGSGNAGFTNAMRVLSKPWAILIFLLDVLKGYLSVTIGLAMLGDIGGIIAAAAVILGHTFPFWLGFRGGKGIAAGFGALLALVPMIALIMLAIWAVAVLISNHISFGSIVAAISMPILAVIFREPLLYIVIFVLCAILVIYMHRGNIQRLKNGTEGKVFKNR